MKQNKHALREQAESWGDKVAVCRWYGQSYDVSSWWTTERRQEMPDREPAKMRAETKPKKTRVYRNEVVGFRWLCIYLVFRGDPVWYRMIYRDISWYHIPYHAISQDTIYWDIVSISRFFFGLISRYLIPSKYSWIPNTIFCPLLGAPGLVHQESKRNNGYLAVELQKQCYLLENMYVRPYGDTQSAGLDAVLRKKNIISVFKYAKGPPARTT